MMNINMKTTDFGFTGQELRGIAELVENLTELEDANDAVSVESVVVSMQVEGEGGHVPHGLIARTSDDTLGFFPALAASVVEG